MEPGAPSFTYLVRIMGVLLSHGELTITNLAMLSRVNHKRCAELVGWLRDSGYVETRTYRNKRYVLLTGRGYNYGNRLLEVTTATRILDVYEAKNHVEDPDQAHYGRHA